MTTPLIRQTWTMSAVLINMIGQGMVLAYPSSLLPALNRPDSTIKVDLHSSSWLGSIVGLAGIPGYLMSSICMDLYGRRITYGLVLLPGIVGWIIIYFAESVTMLMVGRFLGGMSTTATVGFGAIIIGEYTCPKYRGVFLCLKNTTISMGAMLTHIINRYFYWRTISLISLIPPLIAVLIIYTWPESPAWLASKGQFQESEKSFYWLRGNSETSRKEMEDFAKAQKAKVSKQKHNSNYYKNIVNFLRKFTQKEFLRPFFVMVLASAILELSGRHIFQSYAMYIMTDITGEASQAFFYTLGIDIIITVSAVLASVLVRLLNRRTLLFSTGFAAVIVLMSVSLYLFLASKEIIPNDRLWVPIGLLLVYFVLANLGCAPIPIALIGEVYPLSHRAAGAGVSGVWFSICLLATLESTPYLLASIRVHGFFAVYSTVLGVALLMLSFILPETKDRTLQEIENYFSYGKFTSNVDDEANIKMIENKNGNNV